MPGGAGFTGGIFAILLALTAKELFWSPVSNGCLIVRGCLLAYLFDCLLAGFTSSIFAILLSLTAKELFWSPVSKGCLIVFGSLLAYS